MSNVFNLRILLPSPNSQIHVESTWKKPPDCIYTIRKDTIVHDAQGNVWDWLVQQWKKKDELGRSLFHGLVEDCCRFMPNSYVNSLWFTLRGDNKVPHYLLVLSSTYLEFGRSIWCVSYSFSLMISSIYPSHYFFNFAHFLKSFLYTHFNVRFVFFLTPCIYIYITSIF